MSSGKTLLVVITVYCLLVALIFHATLSSMVAIWIRSETFAHGFLILPISVWLAWRMRDRFARLTVRPEPWALILLLGAGLVWWLANLVDVLVVQQLAFVGMLVCGIWAIAGTDVVRCYAFPLGFLFFAVPMGEDLIPPLMMLTADTTEFLVRGSGVPIYREGMFLYLPTGTWSVIEECSGVRYLIASVVLGACYAHLTYTSIWRQLAFLLAAVIVPILANSARAYAVVMVGHLSDMRYGIGADHLLFGWVFFGVIMLLMFWVGGFWQQQEQPVSIGTPPPTRPERSSAFSTMAVAGLAIVATGIWPAAAFAMNRESPPVDTPALKAPVAGDAWQAVEREDWQWHPAQPGADRSLNQVYVRSDASEPVIVGVHLRQYLKQSQGAELVDTTDPWRPVRGVWQIIEERGYQTDLGYPEQVIEARVASADQNVLVWSWYLIDGRYTTNPYLIKLLEAKQQIFDGGRQGTRLFIATPVGDDRQQARQALQHFITAHLTGIEASLQDGVAQ